MNQLRNELEGADNEAIEKYNTRCNYLASRLSKELGTSGVRVLPAYNNRKEFQVSNGEYTVTFVPGIDYVELADSRFEFTPQGVDDLIGEIKAIMTSGGV